MKEYKINKIRLHGKIIDIHQIAYYSAVSLQGGGAFQIYLEGRMITPRFSCDSFSLKKGGQFFEVEAVIGNQITIRAF